MLLHMHCDVTDVSKHTPRNLNYGVCTLYSILGYFKTGWEWDLQSKNLPNNGLNIFIKKSSSRWQGNWFAFQHVLSIENLKKNLLKFRLTLPWPSTHRLINLTTTTFIFYAYFASMLPTHNSCGPPSQVPAMATMPLISQPRQWSVALNCMHGIMDEWTIKTPNPICRLLFKIDLLADFAALCWTDFMDLRYIHSLLVFSTQLVNCCPHGRRNYTCKLLPLYLLSDLPPPPPFPNYINVLYTQTVCGCGGGGVELCCRPYSAGVLHPVCDQI
jgi:hypothetical protein